MHECAWCLVHCLVGCLAGWLGSLAGLSKKITAALRDIKMIDKQGNVLEDPR